MQLPAACSHVPTAAMDTSAVHQVGLCLRICTARLYDGYTQEQCDPAGQLCEAGRLQNRIVAKAPYVVQVQ